jgi:hypothetical protein
VNGGASWPVVEIDVDGCVAGMVGGAEEGVDSGMMG